MVPELGQLALILCLCLAVCQAVLPLFGAQTHRVAYMRVAYYTAPVMLAFTFSAFLCLTYSFVVNDFTVAYVSENSNTHLPLIYRICAVWGAHEGSLLLWVLILTFWSAAVSIFSRALPLDMQARVLSVMGMISVGFFLFILVTSNPFIRILHNVPLDGQDLNPMLQDPGLIAHPPMLYMGYVGFSVAFAFAIAALIAGRLDNIWARWSRPWTIVAWSFLTLGITLGSWWSYRELGWGGWWFWDPVENASFMPWLAGTALMHSLLVTEKRGLFKAWTAILAILTFSLSLLGTFLVRSGILVSVHAFATDPARGLFILQFLSVVIGGSLVLYAWRAKSIMTKGVIQFWSRETFILLNNVLLIAALVTVLLGTIYPLIMQTFNLGKISVGYPYFNAVFTPIMLPLFAIMGIGPLLKWYQADSKLLFKRILWLLPLVALLSCVLPVFVGERLTWTAAICLLAAGWLIFNTLIYLLKKTVTLKSMTATNWSMVTAHIGMAITVIGVGMASTYAIERDVSLKPGESAMIGAYQFTLKKVSDLKGPNYGGAKATILVAKNDHPVTVLYPEERIFDESNIAMAKTAIDANVYRDLYVALGEPVGQEAWSFRLYDKPFVRWIWLGGLLMLLGGLIGLCDKTFRLKRQ